MSSTTVYRLSGIALLIGGVLAAIGNVGQMFNDNPLSPLWIPVSLAIAIGLLLVLLGLPAVYVRQMRRAGTLGLIGFVLFFLACVLFGGSSGLTDIVLLPWVTQLAPVGLNNPTLAFILFFLVAKLLIIIGSIVFGIATLRAGVLPKGSAILLLVGSVLFIVGGRIHAVPYLDYFGEVLFFLSFVWFGFALLALPRNEMERETAPAPTGTEVRA
jgi:hypothetical protein